MRNTIIRFFAMYARSQSVRVAIYRKARAKIGRPLVFGSHIFIDITSHGFRKYGVTIGDVIILAGYSYILARSMLLYGIRRESGSVVIWRGARVGINVTVLPKSQYEKTLLLERVHK